MKKLLCLSLLLTLSACTTRVLYPDLTDDPTVLVRQWTIPTKKLFDAGVKGTEFSVPLLVDQTLVFATQATGVIAMYPGIHQIRWVLPIANGVMSQLEVDNGSVYFGGADGFFYSVNFENGRVNWRYPVRTTLSSKPTVYGGRVFVTTSDDTVYAFDAGTGQWLWHYRRRSAQAATVHAVASPIVDREEVLAGLSDGYLVGLSVQDGKMKWEKKLHTGRKFTDVDATPVIDQGVLYVPSYDGAFYAINRSTNEILWKHESGGGRQVLIEGNRIYLPASDGHVIALNKESAKVQWSFELDDGVPGITLTPQYVIVASTHQYFYVLDKTTGKALYRYNVGDGSGFYSSPVYDAARDRLYVLSGAGNLMAFSIRKPRLREFAHGRTDPYIFKSAKLLGP